MAFIIAEFKHGPLDGRTIKFEGDRPDASVLHTVSHPSPLASELSRYALLRYDTDGTNARATYGEPKKLPELDDV